MYGRQDIGESSADTAVFNVGFISRTTVTEEVRIFIPEKRTGRQ